MTVETTTRVVEYAGDGATTVFAVPFPYLADAHLVVVLIDGGTLVVTVWTLGINYTLTGGAPTGTLTATVAPAIATTLRISRVVPYTQPMNLEPNDGFDAEAMEVALDKLTMMAQQNADTGGGGGSGGTVAIVNIGTGQGVSAGLAGTTYSLRSLKAAGSGLTVGGDADSITYALAGVLLASNNLSDVASRQTALDTLTAVGAATNEFVLTRDSGTGNAVWKVVPTGGGGEANTSSNAGGTVGLALAKVGANLPFRGLTAGSNVTLTPSGTDVTIAATGEANTSSSAGGTVGLPLAKAGVNLPFRGLTAGAGITLTPGASDVTIAAAAPTGEANTISTVASTGQTLIPAVPKVGVDLRTKGIAAGTGITLTPSATDLTISTTGEANTASSAGGTVALPLAKVAANIPFRGLTAGAGITLTPTGTDVTIAAIAGAGEANTISSAGGLSLIPTIAKVGVDLKTKGLAAGLGILLTPATNDITAAIDQAATLNWTGRHTFTRLAGDAPGANGSFRSLSFAMPHLSGNTLTSLYSAVVDVQRTTNATAASGEVSAANTQGGIHGIYVQHVITGVAPASGHLVGGVRSTVDLFTTGTPMEATAFYGIASNQGTNANATWAFFCDVVHNNSNAGAVTRGFGAEVKRANAAGKVYGVEVLNMTAGSMTADAGYRAARQAVGAPGYCSAFVVGDPSAWSGVAGDADVGYDTLNATLGIAAFRMNSGHLFRLGGTTDVADMRYSTTDTATQFLSGGNRTFGVETTGIPVFYETSGTSVGAAGGATALPATPVRYINVRYNTNTLASPVIATGKIAIYNF